MLSEIVIVDSSPLIRQYGWDFVQKNLSKHRHETDKSGFYNAYIECIHTQLPEEILYYKCIHTLLSQKSLSGIITLNPAFHDKSPSIVPLLGTDIMVCPKCGSSISLAHGFKQSFRCACGGRLSCEFIKYGEKINQKTWRIAQNMVASAQMLIVDPKVLAIPLCRVLVEYSGKDCLYCPDIVRFIIDKAEEV